MDRRSQNEDDNARLSIKKLLISYDTMTWHHIKCANEHWAQTTEVPGECQPNQVWGNEK